MLSSKPSFFFSISLSGQGLVAFPLLGRSFWQVKLNANIRAGNEKFPIKIQEKNLKNCQRSLGVTV